MKHYKEESFIQKYPLSRMKPIKKIIQKSFLFLLLSPGLFVVLIPVFMFFSNNDASMSTNLAIITTIVCFCALVFIVYMYERWYYRTYFYNLTDKLIIIRKGPIAPQEISIPFYRVQDVYVDQDILDRLFGLYDVHISTATALSEARAHIDGLEKEKAEKLRELILNKIESSGSSK